MSGALDRVMIAKTEGKEPGEVSSSLLYQRVRGEETGEVFISTRKMECAWLCLAPSFPLISKSTSCDIGTKTDFKLGFMFPATC